MKRTNLEKLPLKMNLQFFAEGGDDSNEAKGTEDSNQGNENKNEDQNSNENSGEKTFTQTEVSSMMAKEKNEGKRSILKTLGFKNEKEAEEAIKKYNEYLESQKTQEEKSKELLDQATSEKDEALKRAQLAEDKLTCYALGIGSEYIDDVIAIASSKVTEDKDLETVLKEMKEDKKYASFFGASNSHDGTGNDPGHSGKQDNKEEGIGKRLAEKAKSNKNAKSSYFDN